MWNTYLRENADWATHDSFELICEHLFDEIVLSKLDVKHDIDNVFCYQGEYLEEYQLYVDHKGKLPLMVNRELKSSGYWDHPVEWIPPDELYDIRLIGFFDFDQLGWRNFEFYRARILKCNSHPEIEQRDVLIRCHHVDVRIIDPEQKEKG